MSFLQKIDTTAFFPFGDQESLSQAQNVTFHEKDRKKPTI